MIANRRSTRTHRGQGMTEYIIIVALVAISAIGVVTQFGDNIKHLFGMSTTALSGETSVQKTTEKSNATLERSGGLGKFADHNGT